MEGGGNCGSQDHSNILYLGQSGRLRVLDGHCVGKDDSEMETNNRTNNHIGQQQLHIDMLSMHQWFSSFLMLKWISSVTLVFCRVVSSCLLQSIIYWSLYGLVDVFSLSVCRFARPWVGLFVWWSCSLNSSWVCRFLSICRCSSFYSIFVTRSRLSLSLLVRSLSMTFSSLVAILVFEATRLPCPCDTLILCHTAYRFRYTKLICLTAHMLLCAYAQYWLPRYSVCHHYTLMPSWASLKTCIVCIYVYV